jgi:DNA-binding CsgD family transcriptional regulator
MHGLALGARRAAAAVFIDNADTSTGSQQVDQLTRLYGLTAAEARIALRIAEGSSPQEVARSLGVSVNTVRTHLHRAFDKTGTRRQAQLARWVQQVSKGL